MQRLAVIGVCAAVLAAAAPVSTIVSAEQVCKPVTGHFEATIVSGPACTSAVGLCTSGRVWGGLQGEYSFTMSTLMPAPEPDTAGINFFTGRSNVDTQSGDDLYGVDTGTIDLVRGGFASLITWTGGTGAYAGTTGQIRLRGSLSGATTSGDYTGTVCQP